MIFVDRNAVPIPAHLKSPRAVVARQSILKLLEEAPQQHLKQLSFRFDSSLWIQAKPALTSLFHGKCAYCESRAEVGLLDIEHFRPKSNASDLTGFKPNPLLYSWLAYDWENLLLACPSCNRIRRLESGVIGKGGRFPVDGSRAQLGASVEKCRLFEKGTLLDPCFDDPREHLTFNQDGRCDPLTSRGELTILVVGLNRPLLVEARQQTLLRLDHELERVHLGQQSGVKAEIKGSIERISRLTKADQPYAGAVRSVLEKRFSLDGKTGPRWADFSSKIIAGILSEQEVRGRVARVNVSSRKRAFNDDSIPDVVDSPTRIIGRKELPPNAMSWLSRIELSNFKSIRSLSIDIPELSSQDGDRTPCLMLLGENAAGKSSILEAVALALLGTRQILGRCCINPAATRADVYAQQLVPQGC
jgi:uncharacterized protein (TIGR02646 family)